MSDNDPMGGFDPDSGPEKWPYLDNQSRAMYRSVRSWIKRDRDKRPPYESLLSDMQKNLATWHESYAKGLPLRRKLLYLFVFPDAWSRFQWWRACRKSKRIFKSGMP